MSNENLKEVLTNAIEQNLVKKTDVAEKDELGAEELDVISGGLMMDMDSAEPTCKGMACGVF